MGYQAFDRHAGFCRLCWEWTEYKVAMENPVLEKCVCGKNRKYVKIFATVERPTATASTRAAALACLEKIIAASNAPDGNPYVVGELLLLYGVGYDRKIQSNQGRILFNQSQESQEAQKIMLDRIEQNLIINDWFSEATQIGVNRFKPRPVDDEYSPVTFSRSFCSDHNPRRSIESRRRYQNDRKRAIDFEAEINRVYSQCISQCIGIHTDDDRQKVRRVAYRNIFSSTLEKIEYLQSEGKTQTEIADILKIRRQAVSNALRRKKLKILESQPGTLLAQPNKTTIRDK